MSEQEEYYIMVDADDTFTDTSGQEWIKIEKFYGAAELNIEADKLIHKFQKLIDDYMKKT